MSVPPCVLAGLESAAKNRMDPDGIKIVGGHDAPSGALGTVSDAERGTHDFGHDEGVNQNAVPLQIDEIRPGSKGRARFAAGRPGKSEQLLLVGYRRVRTEQNPFDPTEDRGIRADSQGEAKDRQDGKARTAPQHPETEAEVLQCGLDHGESSLIAVEFLGLLDATEFAVCFAAGVPGGHAFAQVPFDGHLQVRAQFLVQVVLETTAAEERSETMNENAAKFTHG